MKTSHVSQVLMSQTCIFIDSGRMLYSDHPINLQELVINQIGLPNCIFTSDLVTNTYPFSSYYH